MCSAGLLKVQTGIKKTEIFFYFFNQEMFLVFLKMLQTGCFG
jgi:hypothetical protein